MILYLAKKLVKVFNCSVFQFIVLIADSAFVKGEIGKLAKSFDTLDRELKNMKEDGIDKFKSTFSDFSVEGKTKMENITVRFDLVLKTTSDLIKKYGEREGTKPEEFYKIFDEFSSQVNETIKDLERIRVQSEKEAAKKLLDETVYLYAILVLYFQESKERSNHFCFY